MAFREDLRALVAGIETAARERLTLEHGGPAAVAAEVESEFRTDLSTLMSRWDFFDAGDRSLVQRLVDGIVDTAPAEPGVYGRIEAARAEVARVSAVLDRWDGAAATAFRRSFLQGYGPVVERQLAAVTDLARILRAYDAVIAAARRTILDIGHATTDALAGSTGLVGFPVVGAAAAGAGTSGAGALFDTVAEHEPAPPAHVGGTTVAEVLGSMDGAVTALFGYIDAEEDAIRTAVDTAQGRLDVSLPSFLPAEGAIGDGGLGEPPTDHLIVEVAALYRAGDADLAAAAGGYEQAWRSLDLGVATEPDAFGPWFTRTLPDYRTLRQTFSSQVLLATRDELLRHGDDLCSAALLYAVADGIDAEDILRVVDTGESRPPV